MTRVALESPLGDMVAVIGDDGVVALDFADRSGPATGVDEASVAQQRHADRLRAELTEYFVGNRTSFSVSISAVGGTPFQRRAWSYLTGIPFGQTRTYGQQAAAIGLPTAVRAVGRANGSNRVCLLLPCHRVIGASGALTGYAGGIERKRWLLDHERGRLG